MAARALVPYIGKGSRYGPEELEVLRELLLSDTHLGAGQHGLAFEAELADYLAVRNAVAVSSCSMALELVIRLLDVGHRDEVIASPLTYQATVAGFLDRDCRVFFCDVDDQTLCLDPESVSKAITSRTRAVIVTHYGGAMAKMDELRAICDLHEIVLIEDCAHAMGARYRGHGPGSVGDFGCFSFQSLKNISTLGQGGLITVGDDRLAARLRRLRSGEPDAVFTRAGDVSFAAAGDLGRMPAVATHEKNAYTHNCSSVTAGGLNALLSEPAAAVGRVQLRRLRELVAERHRIAARLDSGLRQIPGVRIPQLAPELQHAHHLYTFFITPDAPVTRNELVAGLADAGIEVVLRYFPLHLLPEWRARDAFHCCPVAERIWFRELVNLPIYPGLANWQVDYMIEVTANLLKRGG